MPGPLDGVRILDLTAVVMGPSATQILADMGAEILKIEPPSGDTMRHIGPYRHPGMGPLFLQSYRNKKSVRLDLKNAADKEALLALVPDADVLVYNIRPQAMARLGLDYDAIRRVNPRIVYCGAFGYGEDGPYAGQPVYDDLMQAASGVAWLSQRVYGEPRYAPLNICDRVVGLYLAISIIGALYHRALAGEGQAIEVPMFETMAQFVLADHWGGHAFVPPIGPIGYRRLLSAHRGPYPTEDGHLCIVVYTDEHWRKFSAMIDQPNLMQIDPRFATLDARTRHAEEIGRFLGTALTSRTTGEWLDLLREADIPAAPVNSLEDLFRDPHPTAVGMFTTEDHPTEGRLRSARFPIKWSRTQPEVRRLAPNLGEHNGEVLGK